MALIEATVTGDELVVARIERLGPTVRQALHDAMVVQALRVQKAVVTEKLSGDPLHRRTAVLATSINQGGPQTASEVVDSGGGDIVARIGTKVRYGKIHEYGGTFEVPAHARKIVGRFGGGKHAMTTLVRAHEVKFPERSFLRSVLSELRPSVVQSIEAAIARAAQGG